MTNLLLVLLLLLARAAYGQISTHHDTIPDFGANPTVVSVADGPWSVAATWSPARIPIAGDVIQIGNAVSYDAVSSARIKTVQVKAGGKLNFRTDVNTQLTVATLQVLAGGALTVGTASVPVPASVTATIVFADLPLDTGGIDPSQYGNGLIALGDVTIYGAAKGTTFVRSSVEPKAGASTLSLASTPADWRVGDKLYIPDSRMLSWGQMACCGGTYTRQWEYVAISAISGSTVTLASPLAFTHPGSHLVPGDVPEFLPHVANMSRSVVLRSENPSGTRGHIMFTDRANADIRYAEIRDMGRTTYLPIDNTTFSGSTVTHVGTNQFGRYPLHAHHLVGPVTAQPNGYQFSFIGNAIVDTNVALSNFKWGIDVHNSHYGLIQDNVVINAAGYEIGTETGEESGNRFDHNFVSITTGSGARDDASPGGLGTSGFGFWFRGPNNFVTNNVAAGIHGNDGFYAFDIYARFLNSSVMVPVKQGADPFVAGGGISQNMYATPIPAFSDNEAYGVSSGLTLWWIGTENAKYTPNMPESIVKNFTLWNHYRYGYYGYETNRVTIDGFVGRGNFNGDPTGLGIWYGDYYTRDALTKNVDLRGLRSGWEPSPFTDGTIIELRDSYLDNLTNVVAQTLYTSAPSSASIPRRTTVVRNVRFGSHPATISMNYSTPGDGSQNYAQTDQMLVYDFGGASGDNFQVYYVEQAPNFIMPPSTFNADGSTRRVGAPVSGLTNQQAWTQYGVATGGAVAPCSDQTSHSRVHGFTCGGIPAASPTPSAPVSTPTPTSTASPTASATPIPPTATPVVPTATPTRTATATPTNVPTALPTATASPIPPTATPTSTPTRTPTTVATITPTPLSSSTPAPTMTPTAAPFTVNYNPPSVGSNALVCQTISVPGIVQGRAVSWSPGVDAVLRCVVTSVRAPADNSVRICWQNTGSGSCEAPISTWSFSQ